MHPIIFACLYPDPCRIWNPCSSGTRACAASPMTTRPGSPCGPGQQSGGIPVVFGLCAAWIPLKRLAKCAVILKPSSVIRFHQALVLCKYRWLYASGKRSRLGLKGPTKEVIAAVVEMKRRNPRLGCRKIAEQISHAFGIEIDKDVVHRILAKHYHPDSIGDGVSWLTAIGHGKYSLWSIDLFRCESILLKSYWVIVVIMSSLDGSSVLALHVETLIGFPCLGCSITPSPSTPCRGMSRRTTIRCSASIGGWRISAFLG